MPFKGKPFVFKRRLDDGQLICVKLVCQYGRDVHTHFPRFLGGPTKGGESLPPVLNHIGTKCFVYIVIQHPPDRKDARAVVMELKVVDCIDDIQRGAQKGPHQTENQIYSRFVGDHVSQVILYGIAPPHHRRLTRHIP